MKTKAKKQGNRARTILVEGVDLGDGRKIKAWVRVSPSFVSVWRYRAHRRWSLPLAVAAGLIARRAQAALAAR